MSILALNNLLQSNSFQIGLAMAIDRLVQQANDIASKALETPINTLIVLVALVAMISVLGLGFLIWKIAPFILKQIQQQIEINAKLTENVGQQNGQSKTMIQALETLGTKTDNQTTTVQTAIEKQTTVIALQNQDQCNYQTLVSDNLADHGDRITENTENIKKLFKRFDTLEESVNKLPETWSRNLSESRTLAIESIKTMIDGLRQEVVIMVGTRANGDAKRQTGTLTAAVVVNTEAKP